jgi:poly-gamma-glutamate synthesis protein (capsule biosynthesis protein)
MADGPRHARAAPATRGRRAIVAASVVAVALVGGGVVWQLTHDRPERAVASSSTTDPTTPSTTTSLATTTTAPATTTTVRDPFLGNGASVTLAFGGDTNFEGVIADRLATDPASIFGGFAPILSAADIAVVNMETAIGTGGTPAPKAYTFQAPPEALEAFRLAGVDVVSAANNHGMDFGPASLEETLAAEAATGFPIIGIGRNEAEAFAPYVVEVRGQRVAVVAATQVLDGSLIDQWTATEAQPGLASAKRVDRLLREVQAARATADTVVVFLHWGTETHTCPNDAQLTLSQQLVDAGADIIVGGHAHRVQGGGRLGGAVVHYGLGNFAFYSARGEGARTGVLTVTVTGRRVDGYQWIPGRIVDRRPEPLSGAEAEAALAHWDDLRACTNLAS